MIYSVDSFTPAFEQLGLGILGELNAHFYWFIYGHVPMVKSKKTKLTTGPVIKYIIKPLKK